MELQMRFPANLSEMQGTVIPELISIRPAGKPPQDFLTADHSQKH